MSFGIQYWLAGRYYVHDKTLQWFWASGFAPLPTSLNAATWYLNTLIEIFNDPGGYKLAAVGSLFVPRRVHSLAAFASPSPGPAGGAALVTLAVSALHGYPFEGRVLLWAAPLLLLLMAAGIEGFWQCRSGRRIAPWRSR